VARPGGGRSLWARHLDPGADPEGLRRRVARCAVTRGGDPARGVFVSKRIDNLPHIRLLPEIFGPSLLVHLVRDVRRVVPSLLRQRRAKAGGVRHRWSYVPEAMAGTPCEDPVTDCGLQWMHINRHIEDARAHYGGYLCLRYEDFCANPLEVLGRVGEFTGLQFDPDHPVGHIAPPAGAPELTAEETARLCDACADGMHRYGYA
jgi:hypothetical protein